MGLIEIRVTIPRASLSRLERVIDGRAVAFAEREALNGTIGAVQKVAIREIADEMGLSQTALRRRGRQRSDRSSRTGKVGALPTRKATRSMPRAKLTGYGKPFNLIRFGGQEVKTGSSTGLTGRRRRGRGRAIAVVHKAWGRYQVATGMFQLNVQGKPIVVRSGNKLRGAYGPGVTHVMEYPRIRTVLERKALLEFPERYIKRLRYAFSSSSHVR